MIIIFFPPNDSGGFQLSPYFHSNQDPSGLLLLPPKGAPADFDISPILAVMETLLHVATKEVRRLQGVRSLTFQVNDGFHIFLSPLSVR